MFVNFDCSSIVWVACLCLYHPQQRYGIAMCLEFLLSNVNIPSSLTVNFVIQLLDSMQAGRWLDEEEYEVKFFPSAKQVRMLRNQSPGWTLPLFRSVKGHVYVSPDTEPPSVSCSMFIVRFCLFYAMLIAF